MKHEYHEGPETKKEFESTMTALFRVPKDEVKKPEKPAKDSEKRKSEEGSA